MGIVRGKHLEVDGGCEKHQRPIAREPEKLDEFRRDRILLQKQRELFPAAIERLRERGDAGGESAWLIDGSAILPATVNEALCRLDGGKLGAIRSLFWIRVQAIPVDGDI